MQNQRQSALHNKLFKQQKYNETVFHSTKHCMQLDCVLVNRYLFEALRRCRNKGTCRHQLLSQGSDGQNQTSNRPQDSATVKLSTKKKAKNQGRSDNSRINWSEHTVKISQAHQEQALGTTNPRQQHHEQRPLRIATTTHTETEHNTK